MLAVSEEEEVYWEAVLARLARDTGAQRRGQTVVDSQSTSAIP